MYNPNVPSSNMGIAPVSSAPSQPLGPTPMMGMAPMGPPPPMAPPPMGPPPIAPITEGLGGFGGSRAGRAGFSERMQKMTAPPKPKPMPQPQQMQRPVQGMQYGGMVGGMLPGIPSFGQLTGRMPYRTQRDVSNSALSKSGGGIDQYGEYLDNEYGDPQFDQKRDSFLQGVSQQEQQTFGGGGGMGGKMGGIGSFAPQVMNQPFMGGALQQGFPLHSYSTHRQGAFNSSPFGGRFQLFEDGGEVPRDVNPVEMALGGFIGNENTRDYNDRYTDPYEELDDIYEDDGGYDPTDPYDDDGDDRDFDLPVPTPAPPVSPPSDDGDGGGGDDGDGRPVGPNNAQEALDQANADFKAGRGDIADLDLATLASRISRGRDVMPASLGSIDAISRNFAVPAPTDTTFSDPEIFDLSNPISLEAAKVVGPNPRTDAIGNLVPGRADTASEIQAGTEAALNLGPEVMSSSPASSGDMRDVNVGLSPVISGMSDRVLAGTAFSPLGSSGAPSYGDLSVSNATPPAPKMALPGGSARRPEDFDLGMPADQQAAVTAFPMTAGQLSSREVAPSTGGGPVFTRPDGTVLTPADQQAATINAQARLEAGLANKVRGIDTGVDTMALEEEAYPSAFSDDMQPVDDMQIVGATRAALKRAEDDVSALDRIAEARMPTDDMQIVPTAPAQTAPADVPDISGGTAPKSNFDFKYPNTGKTDEVFIDPTDSKVYFDDRFDKTSPMSKAFSQLVSSLSYGLIDLDKINKKQRDKGEEAYKKTQTLAYDNKGRVIGVKDVDGSTISLSSQPQDEDDTGGDDGCPPGFRRVNGVCQPIDGVSANPADDIADDIEKATMPIIRPLDPPTGDVSTDPVADDPSGIDFRRPNYFAGGGAVSEGMGSAIDNFLSSMSR